MVDFNRIYLDSEPLLEGPWPRLSQNLDNALKLAQRFGVEVVIPLAVERELEVHWMRELEGNIRSASKGMKKVRDECARSPVNKRCLLGAWVGEGVSWGDGLEDRRDNEDLVGAPR